MTKWFYCVAIVSLLGSVDGVAQQIISVGSGAGPMAIAIDPDANLAVVANRNNNTVSIIDLSSNSTRSTVTVGTTPTSVAINPRTHEAVVTNFGSDDISVIDLDTAEVIATIPVGNSPRDVAIDTDNNVAIVVNLNDGSVSLIDLGTYGDLLSTPIQVGDAPIGYPRTTRIEHREFTGTQHTLCKAITAPRPRGFDAADVDDVRADTEDHAAGPTAPAAAWA